MKRFCLLAGAALFAGLCASTDAVTAGTMTVNELVEKHIEARGGLENIHSITTMRINGKFFDSGMEIPFVATWKRPNLLRIDMNLQGALFAKAYDGQVVWIINPFSGSNAPQKDSEFEQKTFPVHADIDGFLVDWKDKGYTVESSGKDEVEGTEVFHLRVDTHREVKVDLYLDTEYFLIIKMTYVATEDEKEWEVDMFYSDFKEVGGVVLPHLYDVRVGGQTTEQYLFEMYEFGVEVDDSIFAMPAVEETEGNE
jgi:outer membrane lipoprotein-sorting protein